MNYTTYLKSNLWKSQKNKTKYWHGNKCQLCGAKKVDIHHKTYKNGLGNECPKNHLIPLCRKHHYEVHSFSKENNINIFQATQQFIKQYKLKNNIKQIKVWDKMTPLEREKYLGKGL